MRVYTESPCELIRAIRIGRDNVTDKLLSRIEYYRQEHFDYDSYLERMFMEKIEGLGVNFDREVYFNISNSSFYLDFFNPASMVAVEIDGAQHESLRSRIYDLGRERAFLFIGIVTIRFNRAELIDDDFKYLFLARYKKALGEVEKIQDKAYVRRKILSLYAKREALRDMMYGRPPGDWKKRKAAQKEKRRQSRKKGK